MKYFVLLLQTDRHTSSRYESDLWPFRLFGFVCVLLILSRSFLPLRSDSVLNDCILSRGSESRDFKKVSRGLWFGWLCWQEVCVCVCVCFMSVSVYVFQLFDEMSRENRRLQSQLSDTQRTISLTRVELEKATQVHTHSLTHSLTLTLTLLLTLTHTHTHTHSHSHSHSHSHTHTHTDTHIHTDTHSQTHSHSHTHTHTHKHTHTLTNTLTLTLTHTHTHTHHSCTLALDYYDSSFRNTSHIYFFVF